MKVLIVGANGFIGQAMARHVKMVHPTADIVGVVRPDSRAVPDTPFRAVRQIEQADLLIYLVGRGGIPESITDPADAFQANCQEAITALETARTLGVSQFVLASTCALYPRGPHPAQEHGPLSLQTPYAKAKRTAELYGITASELTGQDVRVVRLANVYGPKQRRQLIYDVAMRALGGEKVELQSSGTEKRDFVHVDDTARAIWAVAENGKPGGIYNVGSGTPRSVRDAAKLICASFGAKLTLPEATKPDTTGSGDAYPDITKLLKLGFEPQIDFETGLNETLNWIRSTT
ncbi:MAG: NAD(P)-dependent oxidoreductase [Pseudomonadota bacterium]